MAEIQEEDSTSLGPAIIEEQIRTEPKNVPICSKVDKTDLFMVIDGQCYISFDVKITYDQSDALK